MYLPFSDWFGSKRTSVWIQINLKMVNTIWFQVDSIRFRKYFSVCSRKIRQNRRYEPTFSPNLLPSIHLFFLHAFRLKKLRKKLFFCIRLRTLRISWDIKKWLLLEGVGVCMPGYVSDDSKTEIWFRVYFLTSKYIYYKNATIRFWMFQAFYNTDLIHKHDFELMDLLIDSLS